MKLHQAPASPFVRKVVVAAFELGLEEQIERILVRPHPVNRNAALVALNPLGQIPALELANGELLADSAVIVEYLTSLVEGQSILPQGPRRWQALTEQALCDGLLAACLSIRYERSTRDPALQSQAWIGGQMGKIESVLDHLERAYAQPAAGFDIGHIAVGSSLGYLAFRFPEIDLAARWPKLATWWAQAQTRPSFAASTPQE